MAPFKVIIVGGGLAGSLLAAGLLRRGIDFLLYERDNGDSKREGYQIRLGAAALKGFKACLEQEQIDALMKKFGRSGGLVASAPILYDTNLNCLLDLTKFPAYTKSAPINRVVLVDFLRQPVRTAGKLRYSKRLIRYQIVPDTVRVLFDDGTSDEGDLLISAEGSSSKINKQIGLDNIVQLTVKWGFLAKSSLPVSRLLSLTPEVQKAPVTCIKDGVILFYSAYMPDATGNSTTGTAAAGALSKDGIVIYDENAASVFWGISVPADRVPPGGGTAIPNKLDYCIEQTKTWDKRYHDMLRVVTDDNDIYVFQARASTQPALNWRRKFNDSTNPALGNNQVWLMGDAIHPMLPARGMGGNQSLHDAADIFISIEDLYSKANAGETLTSTDYTNAVKQYEDAMIPRAFGWVRTSGGTGSEMVEPSSLKGKLMLFFVARALDIAYLYSLVRSAFGWVPKDDAPELPN